MIRTLPKGRGWLTEEIVLYQGCWLHPMAFEGVLLVQNHFKARPTDIFLAAFMKCGTTWLRALMFATINRSQYNFSTHPLLNCNPHRCFVSTSYSYMFPIAIPLLQILKPFLCLDSLLLTCQIVYFINLSHHVATRLQDVLVSKWHYVSKVNSKDLPPLSLPEAFELFCEGVSEYGPFWDQQHTVFEVRGYAERARSLP